MPGSASRASALDHVVVVLFENRSLDNVLGRLLRNVRPTLLPQVS